LHIVIDEQEHKLSIQDKVMCIPVSFLIRPIVL